MIRVDYHFSEATTGFVRFNRDKADYLIPTGALNVRQETDTKLFNGVAEMLHVFSPTVVNEGRFGINEDQYHIPTLSQSPDGVSVSGFSALSAPTTSDGRGTTYSYQSTANFLHNALDSATYMALTPLKRLRKTQDYGYDA